MRRNVFVLITVYFPTKDNCKNIKEIVKQADYTYICDNSKIPNKELSCISKSKYVFNGENLGLSNAFNKVLRNEKFLDEDLIIFFDQDSTISPNYINNLVSKYEELEKSEKNIGCVGPNFYNSFSSDEDLYYKGNTKKEFEKVNSLITSSMLCKFSVLKSVNFWNEKIFLDLSDWDLCWRMKQKGYFCFLVQSIKLCHSLGKGEKKIGCFKLKIGNPFRIYYQTRDCLQLLSKNYVPFVYRIRFFLMLTIRPILYFIFLGEKKERIYFFLKGIRDFDRKYVGEYRNNE